MAAVPEDWGGDEGIFALVADTQNELVRGLQRFGEKWGVATVCGDGSRGALDGDAAEATFAGPVQTKLRPGLCGTRS